MYNYIKNNKEVYALNYKENYNNWLTAEYIDENSKKELLALTDENEIKDRFYKTLEFGTGGLRGIIGAGDNRINKYTIRKATQGLVNYIKKNPIEGKDGVAIAYDSRNFSPDFAEYASEVFAGNGIKVYLFDSLRPTPELSFAIRELNCISGIVITASHNPSEYNGYKVYWEDGCQIQYPRDMAVITEVNAITNYGEDITFMNIEEAKEKGLVTILGEEIDNKYLDNVVAQVVNQDIIKENNDISIVYTPLHGTGYLPVKNAFTKVGFTNFHIVEEQAKPDGNFSTVSYPNPEEPAVFKLAMELAEKVDAEIILGTDPDADRVGAVVKNNNGEYVVLNGNMTGVLIAEYLCSQKAKNGTLPKNGALVSTIVSTKLTRAIAEHYNLAYFETLTGFKYIGEKILEFEKNNSYEYIFGFEESFGSLTGTYARDKDAVGATLLLAEIATYYKTLGKTLYDALQDIYAKYGFYKEDLSAITLKGLDGLEVMKKSLSNLRSNPPKAINNLEVISIRDYDEQHIINTKTNAKTATNMVKSNVLYYELEDGSWCCVRPSGTEPKIKLYFGTKDDSQELVDNKLKNLMESMTEIFNQATK